MRDAAIRFAVEVLSREKIFDGLRRVLPALVDGGVAVMPLKGVLLSTSVPQLRDRPMSDADILVPRSSFSRAVSLLTRLGGRALPLFSPRKCVVAFPGPAGDWSIDLHGDLWDRGYVDLDLEDAWRRATPGPSPFGAPLHWPPRDFAFAHVVLHYARGGRDAASRPERARDLPPLLRWVLETTTIESLAAYQARSGAANAAYYALSSLPRELVDRSADALREALGVSRWRRAVLGSLARGRPRVHPRVLRAFITTSPRAIAVTVHDLLRGKAGGT